MYLDEIPDDIQNKIYKYLHELNSKEFHKELKEKINGIQNGYFDAGKYDIGLYSLWKINVKSLDNPHIYEDVHTLVKIISRRRYIKYTANEWLEKFNIHYDNITMERLDKKRMILKISVKNDKTWKELYNACDKLNLYSGEPFKKLVRIKRFNYLENGVIQMI